MTEQELMDLDFEKVWVMDEESDNGYDYHYFRKKLIDNFTVQADYIEGRLTAFTNEPNFVIRELQTLKELIDVFSKIKNDSINGKNERHTYRHAK
jgi:hypothetical protein